ncbi:MAG: acyl-CoA thioesterase [Rubrobacter sp.]|nr:acyl-CoA thioesterase [Rubrobacter sp.]
MGLRITDERSGAAEESEAVPASRSRTVKTSLVLPSDTNHFGTIFGGNVLSFVDEVAAIAAMRHSRMPVVTASMDSADFLHPIHAGEAMEVEAFVSWTARSSMEIFVRVRGEDLLSGERRTTATSFLTMVAVDEHGNSAPVPPVEPETDEQRRLMESASSRQTQRRKRKKENEARRKEEMPA